MIIGIPKEIMKHEGRVGITPEGVQEVLFRTEQKVEEIKIQNRAGIESGYDDYLYSAAGALIKLKAQLIYQADLVIKVKEPQEEEYGLLKEKSAIFAFLHLPANPKLAKILQKKKITGIAYEGIQLENKVRPVLQPMSEIAGKRAVEEGLRYLKKDPKSITVVILGGAGVVGQAAVKTARSLGTKVVSLDLPGKVFPAQFNNYKIEISTPETIRKAIKEADLFIGAIAIPGERAKKLVSREMVSSMKPSSVIVDVAIDEGGCIETSKPTDYDNPVFIEEKIIHYCVKNIPGIWPKISTPALTSVTLPYILEIADKGLEKAIKENRALAKGTHIYQGKITNSRLAETLGEEYTPLETLFKV